MFPADFDVKFDRSQLNTLSRNLKQGEPIVLESVHRRKDSSTYPVEVRISPFPMNGKVCAISTAHDISRRKADEQALQLRLFYLTVLNQIGVACSKANSIDEILTESTRLIAKEFFPDNCGFFLLDSVRHSLTPHHAFAITSQDVVLKELSTQQGIVGRAARSGEVQRIANVRLDPDFVCFDPRTQSELSLPLFVAGKLYGVMNIEQSRAESFSEADERLMVAVLDLIGIAIDRIEKQEQLRMAHRQFTSIFETVADVVFLIKVESDGGYRFEITNPAFTECTGIPLDAVIGKRVETIVPEPSLSLIREKYWHAIQNRSKVIWEETTTYPNGTVVGEVCVTPVFDESGLCTHLVGSVHDFTERKRNEDEIRKLNKFRETIIQTAAEGICVCVPIPDFPFIQFTVWNDQMTSITGYTLEEINHLGWHQALYPDPDTREQARQRMESMRCGEELRSEEWQIVRRDGTERVISISTSRLEMDDGMPGTAALIQDVTERKRSESELQRTTALLSAVTEGTIDAVYVKDIDGKYLMINQAGARAFGKSVSDIVGHDDAIFLCPDEAMAIMRRDSQVMITGETDTYEETFSIDGELKSFVSVKGPFRNERGEIVGLIGISRDISKYKEAERLLRLSSFSIDRGVDSVFWISPDGEILHVNETACRTLGYAREELVGKTVPEIDPNFPANLWSSHWEEIRQRRSFSFESFHATKDGTILETEVTVNYLQYEGQEYNCAVMRDITERKRSEKQLRDSEERYRRLVSVLPSAVFISSSGVVSFCNPSFVKLVGATDASELIGKDPFQFIQTQNHPLFRSRIEDMKATRLDLSGTEIPFVRVDGQEVLVYLVATILDDRAAPSILFVLADLTERERSMNLLSSIMQSVNDGIISTDDQGVIKLVNPAVERLFGHKTHELLGTNISRLMPEPHATRHDDYLANYLQTGEAKIIGIGRELSGRRKDGTTFPLDLTVSEFRLESQTRFTGVIRDISERRRLEEQFHQAQKMEAIGQLAGGVAHDFNNLLTIINGYGDLLCSQQSLDDFCREAVKEILNAGQRAAQLTRQLLAFSRKTLVEPKILDLNELITSAQRMLKRLVGEHIQFVTKLEAGLGHIKADRGQIDQVILNIVMNAADAMPTGGCLTIQTQSVVLTADDLDRYPERRPGRYVKLTFQDNGHGMTKQIKDRIFEPFFTTKPMGKGTGLGLSVVHGIIQQAQAIIEVESVVGQGTTFTIMFSQVDDVASKTLPVSDVPLPSGNETILLVEDEDSVRKMTRSVLVSQGYHILEAENGKDAIDLVARHEGPIAALITDVVMPGMSGRDLAVHIQQMRPRIRVLYMSGYTDDAVIRHGILGAVSNFLQKPFSPQELARKLRRILDEQQHEGV